MSKKLDNIIENIKKTYKVDIPSARRAGVVERLTLDSPGLNYAFGGGMPLGRMMYFQGPESGGKTTLASYLAMQVQQKYTGKNTVVYFDYEYTLDSAHLEEMGIDVDNNFIILRPSSGEDGWNMARDLVDSGEVGLIVIDSVTAMASKAACEDAFGGFSGGKTAAMIANGIRMILPYLYNNKCSLIMISQERASMSTYGADFRGTGGRAPAFYSTWSARITRTGEITGENKEMEGIEMRVRNTKNKVGIAKRDANLKLFFKGGINSEEEYMDYMVALGILNKQGAMYEVPGDPWGMGRVRGMETVKTFLKEHPDIYEQVKRDINALISGHTLLDDNEQVVTEEEKASGAWDEVTEEDLQ